MLLIEDFFCKSLLQEVPDDYTYNNHQNEVNNHQSSETVMIKIDIPSPLRDEQRFPKEKWKTFVCKYFIFTRERGNFLNCRPIFEKIIHYINLIVHDLGKKFSLF